MYSLPSETIMIIAENCDCITLINLISSCKIFLELYNEKVFPLHFQLLSLAKENFVIPLSFQSSIKDMIKSWSKFDFRKTSCQLVRSTLIKLTTEQLSECRNNMKWIIIERSEEQYKIRFTTYTEDSETIYVQLGFTDGNIDNEMSTIKNKSLSYVKFDRKSKYFPVPDEYLNFFEQGKWRVFGYSSLIISSIRNESKYKISEKIILEQLLKYHWDTDRVMKSLIDI